MLNTELPNIVTSTVLEPKTYMIFSSKLPVPADEGMQ